MSYQEAPLDLSVSARDVSLAALNLHMEEEEEAGMIFDGFSNDIEVLEEFDMIDVVNPDVPMEIIAFAELGIRMPELAEDIEIITISSDDEEEGDDNGDEEMDVRQEEEVQHQAQAELQQVLQLENGSDGDSGFGESEEEQEEEEEEEEEETENEEEQEEQEEGAEDEEDAASVNSEAETIIINREEEADAAAVEDAEDDLQEQERRLMRYLDLKKLYYALSRRHLILKRRVEIGRIQRKLKNLRERRAVRRELPDIFARRDRQLEEKPSRNRDFCYGCGKRFYAQRVRKWERCVQCGFWLCPHCCLLQNHCEGENERLLLPV